MGNLKSTKINLLTSQIEGLDKIAAIKTTESPVKWSRSSCARQAVNQYLKWFKATQATQEKDEHSAIPQKS